MERPVTKICHINGAPIALDIDNRYVVPYNPYLLIRYDAHINVEIVNSIASVKYLYKYIEKGPDQCLARIEPEQRDRLRNDEVSRYELSRYISASEAYWRIYGYEIQWKNPPVQMLALHLPGEQIVLFENDRAEEIVDNGPPKTHLTAFFQAMRNHPEKQHILYPDVYQHFTFNSKEKVFKLRKRRLSSRDDAMSDTVGRLPIIRFSPHTAELFYLRMLLYRVPGPTCYDDLKLVNGVQSDTFASACIAHGIIEDDNEIDRVLEEAANAHVSGAAVREVFATMLMFVVRSNHRNFFERHTSLLAEDLVNAAGLEEANHEIINDVLISLSDHVSRHGFELNKNFGLPEPNRRPQMPRIIQHEVNNDMETLQADVLQNRSLLTEEQSSVVVAILNSVSNSEGKIIALDAPGGTGKSFVLNQVLNQVRYENKVALATASSGIAATLLPKGTTFHSRTKCPIILNEDSMLNVSENDSTAALLRMAVLLVIDEITMMNRYALEAADRTLQWLRQSQQAFGGLTVVLSGDWRQILTVVPHGSRSQIIGQCLKSSYLWHKVESFRLTVNMRVRNAATTVADDQAAFAQYLLDLGDGKIPLIDSHSDYAISIHDSILFEGNTLEDFVNWVFPDLQENCGDPMWLCERSILCPTNQEIDQVNELMTRRFPGESYECCSVDSVESDDGHTYPQEFLNTLCPSGIPPHKMTLKEGMIIMLLRNFDQENGHCNGSRFILERILPRLLIARSVTGVHTGRLLLIPRIPLSPSENLFPFTFTRKQFPVRPCFAMTVNKSQGQSLKRVGLFCTRELFSHGQLYVAASRVGSSSNIRILHIDPKTKQKKSTINNVVFKEVLTLR